jgi:hypothetical protein
VLSGPCATAQPADGAHIARLMPREINPLRIETARRAEMLYDLASMSCKRALGRPAQGDACGHNP